LEPDTLEPDSASEPDSSLEPDSGWIRFPYRGLRPRVHPRAFVAPGVALVGDVELAEHASVWFGCVIRGDVQPVRIGPRSNVQDGTIVHVSRAGLPTHVGADVTVGHACVLHACTLEDRAFVGMSSTLLDRSCVEGDAMLAAGSLLTPGKRVPSGQLWGGRPARLMRELRPEEIEGFAQRTAHYVALAQEYLREAYPKA